MRVKEIKLIPLCPLCPLWWNLVLRGLESRHEAADQWRGAGTGGRADLGRTGGAVGHEGGSGGGGAQPGNRQPSTLAPNPPAARRLPGDCAFRGRRLELGNVKNFNRRGRRGRRET